MISREYALQRLDEWYIDRIDEGYTDTLAYEIQAELGERLRQLQLHPAEVQNAVGTFSRAQIVESAKMYFRSAFTSIEVLATGVGKPHINSSAIPEGVRQEYVDPMVQAHQLIQQFVNVIRAKTDAIFPDDLTNEDIDTVFENDFGGADGMIHFAKEYAAAFAPFLDLKLSKYSDQNRAKSMRQIIDAIIETAPKILMRVFGKSPGTEKTETQMVPNV